MAQPSQPPARPSPPGPPPRPQLSDRTPAPLRVRRTPPPASVTASARLWLASALAGLVAAALAWTRWDERREALVAEVLSEDPNQDADLAASVVAGALGASLAVIVVLALLEALLAVLVRRRRPWARVLLVVLAVLHLAAAVPLAQFVAEPGWEPGASVRWALVAELVLGLAGLVTVLLPSATAWLRRR